MIGTALHDVTGVSLHIPPGRMLRGVPASHLACLAASARVGCAAIAAIVTLYNIPAGDRAAAVEAYKAAEEKTAGAGLKMDQVFSLLR